MKRNLFEGADARWPRASAVVGRGRIRERLDDFRVIEKLAFVPSGEGEHVFLEIEKRGLNTAFVQSSLAKHFGVSPMDVSYAGLKDRRAVARQWFSVWLPRPVEMEISNRDFSGFSVIDSTRHVRKLRRGEIEGNCFQILVRGFVGCEDTLTKLLGQNRLPNYFGPQRFGHAGSNIDRATRWVGAGRPTVSRAHRSIYLSTLRSLLFNDVVAFRIRDRSWNSVRTGDVCVENYPTGPLWGRGLLPTTGVIRDLEIAAVANEGEIRDALEWVGLKQDRRQLTVQPTQVTCRLDGDRMSLLFFLPKGAYATTILREVLDLDVISSGA